MSINNKTEHTMADNIKHFVKEQDFEEALTALLMRHGWNEVIMNPSEEDLVRIMVEPKNAISRQYQKLLEMDGVALEITEDALGTIAQKAIDRQIGARGLRAIMEKVMTGIMFRIPSDLTIQKVILTPECIEGGEPTILRDPAHPRQPLSGK